jgi:hypothetical protein
LSCISVQIEGVHRDTISAINKEIHDIINTNSEEGYVTLGTLYDGFNFIRVSIGNFGTMLKHIFSFWLKI